MALEDAFELAKGSIDHDHALTRHQPGCRHFHWAIGTAMFEFVNDPLWNNRCFFSEAHYLPHPACVTEPAVLALYIKQSEHVAREKRRNRFCHSSPSPHPDSNQRQQDFRGQAAYLVARTALLPRLSPQQIPLKLL